MEKTIRIRINKEISGVQEKNILHLKGQLISKGYTDIIHIHDHDEESYVNSFIVNADKIVEAIQMIELYRDTKNLSQS
jgi:hypothetical protein